MREGIPQPRQAQLAEHQLDETIEHLRETAFEVGTDHVPRQELRIKRNITPNMLEAFGSLPFEALLIEEDDHLLLFTGGAEEVGTREVFAPAFTIHNHPRSSIAVPSNGDIENSRNTDPDVNFIVGYDGIVLHHHESINDETPPSRAKELSWQITRGRGEDHALRRMQSAGIVDTFIPWTEHERIQVICDYLNGEDAWDDLKEKVADDPRSIIE